MITVTVLYPKTSDSHFDEQYYVTKHMPLVESRFGSLGMRGFQLLRGASSLDGGSPAFAVIAQLTFESLGHLQHALQTHGAEIMGDIPNFTNVQPLLQINQPLL